MGNDENEGNISSLGERLATLRKKYGYSQQEIADRLAVTRQTISNWGMRTGGACPG